MATSRCIAGSHSGVLPKCAGLPSSFPANLHPQHLDWQFSIMPPPGWWLHLVSITTEGMVSLLFRRLSEDFILLTNLFIWCPWLRPKGMSFNWISLLRLISYELHWKPKEWSDRGPTDFWSQSTDHFCHYCQWLLWTKMQCFSLYCRLVSTLSPHRM